MPKLPSADNLSEVNVGPAQRLVNIPNFDFSGINQLGRSITSIGQSLGDNAVKEDDFNAKVAAVKASGAFEQATADLDPEDPAYTSKVQSAFDNTITKSVIPQIRDPKLRKSYQEKYYLKRMELGFDSDSKAREAAQGRKVEDLNLVIDGMKKDAVKPNAGHDDLRKEAVALIDQAPLSPAQKRKAIREVSDWFDSAALNAVTQSYGARPEGERIATIKTDGDADLSRVDPVAMDLFQRLQGVHGSELMITSGFRSEQKNADVKGANKSEHLDGDAIDISTRGMNRDQVLTLIQQASSLGFGGIGVYDGSLHLDIGSRRSWGPSYGIESVPTWAKPAIDAHLANQFKGQIPVSKRNYTEIFAATPAFQRMDFASQQASLSDAQTYFKKVDADSERVSTLNQKLLQSTVDSHIASLEDNGMGVTGFDEASYVESLDDVDRNKYIARRDDAAKTYKLLEGLDGKQDRGDFSYFEDILSSAEPQAGAPDFEAQQKRYEKLEKEIKRVRDERSKDPAGAAEKANMMTPELADSYKRRQPGSGVFVVRERLAVQESLGITPDLTKPLTNKEAAEFAQPLMSLAKVGVKRIEDEGAADLTIDKFIDKTWPQLVQVYGPYADDALVQIIGTVTASEDRARAMMNVWGDLVGQRMDTQRGTQGTTIDLEDPESAQRFIDFTIAGDVVLNPNYAMDQPEPMVLRDKPVRIPSGAITDLQQDFDGMSASFDQLYGSKQEPNPSRKYRLPAQGQ
jgi:hypothetical protein